MTIQECYQKLGGDYAQVEKRLPSVSLIKRFITKFLTMAVFPSCARPCRLGSGSKRSVPRIG